MSIKDTINRVKKELKKFFYKLFSRKKAEHYTKPVLNAAQNNAYVETVSDKADAFHIQLKKLYEEDLQDNYVAIMNELAPKFRRGKVQLAIDKHEIGYYGKKESLYIVGTSYGSKSFTKAYEYLSISLLTGKKEERIHLYALPWHIGQDMVESVAILLRVVEPWFDKIEVVQFDRGFYKKELIYWLAENDIPYLIHAKSISGEVKNIIATTKSFYCGKYKRTFGMNKTTYLMETNLYVCKDIKNKDWIFVSSIRFSNKWEPYLLYKNRWQIETNYAINNQNRIMSKSTNYIIRYFYFLCDILLQVLWRVYALCQITFKTFLLLFVVTLQQILTMKPRLFKPPKKREYYGLVTKFLSL